MPFCDDDNDGPMSGFIPAVGTTPNYVRFATLCLGLGLAAQIVLYSLYTTPYAFYTDTYTTALIQVVVGALLIHVAHRLCFQCDEEVLTSAQRVGSVLMVSGFVITTAYRLPIPVVSIVVSTLAKSTVDARRTTMRICGIMSLRALIAAVILAGTTGILADAIALTDAGMLMWMEAKNEAAIAVGYVLAAVVYFLGVWMVNTARRETMHTGAVVRYGFTGAVPVILVVFALSFIPRYNRANTAFSPSDTNALDEVRHILVLLATSVLKLVALACLVESVKIGELFSYSAFSAMPYIVFVITTAAAQGGQLPPASWAGLVLITSSLVIIVAGITVFNTRFTYADDETCKACTANKRFCCGLAWKPAMWFNPSKRTFDAQQYPMMHAQVDHGDDDRRKKPPPPPRGGGGEEEEL